MTIIAATGLSGESYKNSYFSLKINPRKESTKIRMDLLIPFFSTKDFPKTHQILKRFLPSIMYSACFNENNFSFSKEVKNTELGHLFEHMILEYICDLKRLKGDRHPIHNGLTSWNWQKDIPGRFNINLDVSKKDKDLLREAVRKSVNLLSNIIDSSTNASLIGKMNIIQEIKENAL